MRPALAPLIVLALLSAGCLAQPQDGEPASAPEAAASAATWDALRALMADVPCEADVGEGTSANLLKLSELAFDDGAVGEIDIRDGLALVARYQNGGFHVVDISDPQSLSIVATLEIPETMALDVKWSLAGDAAYVGDFGRIHVVDMRDPLSPTLASTFQYKEHGLSGQAHMLTPAVIDGQEWIYVATQTMGQPLLVFLREGLEVSHQGSYALPGVKSLALGNHDMTIVEDELLGGAPVLYVADGFAGWSAADLSNPASPERIGGSLSAEPGPGYTHTIRVEFIDGKRIVATMAEVGANTLKIYDATDLQAPILLARWNADETRPHIPQHNIQLKDGLLYMGHYTEGVYVFNVTDVARGPPLLGSLALAPIARYAVENPDEPTALGFANVWEVALKDGILYVNDMSNGLHAVGFGCLRPGDATQTATA